MVRMTALVTLLAMLVLLLYVPVTRSPDYFASITDEQYQRDTHYWSPELADEAIDRMRRLHPTVIGAVPPIAPPTRLPPTLAPPLQREIDRIGAVLAGNAYLKSVDAVLALGTYRLRFLGMHWSLSALLMVAAVGDGLCRRTIRSREFLQHDPEVFGLCTAGFILLACSGVVLCVLPLPLHPGVLPLVAPAMALLVGQALGHYHKPP